MVVDYRGASKLNDVGSEIGDIERSLGSQFSYSNVCSSMPTLGLALGGGFARGMAHVGVLQVLEEARIPISFIAGVSAGSLVAAAYASGTSPAEIARIASTLRFADVARWKLRKLGLCCTDGMGRTLDKLLKHSRFEDMRIPLSVSATDLQTGEPVVFSGSGDVEVALRASCAFPGIFQPVRWNDRVLTDGAISMEVPAALVRKMGAQFVVAVGIPHDRRVKEPDNALDVMSRALQIVQMRAADEWRAQSDLVIMPAVTDRPWHDFRNAAAFIEAGAAAARAMVPAIQARFEAKTLQPAA